MSEVGLRGGGAGRRVREDCVARLRWVWQGRMGTSGEGMGVKGQDGTAADREAGRMGHFRDVVQLR